MNQSPDRSRIIQPLLAHDPRVTLTALGGMLTSLSQADHLHLSAIKGLAMFDFIFTYSDAAIYFWMATVGTVLLLIRVALALFLGADGDFDADGDVDITGDATGSFTVFSILSILAFIAGTGWMGLMCRVNWELGAPLSALIAAAFGCTLGLIAAVAMFQMRKLASEAGYDLQSCVNSLGSVYVNIPRKGQGAGQVQVNVEGRRRILRAVSNGPAFAAFEDVKIIAVLGENSLVVDKPDAASS